MGLTKCKLRKDKFTMKIWRFRFLENKKWKDTVVFAESRREAFKKFNEKYADASNIMML